MSEAGACEESLFVFVLSFEFVLWYEFYTLFRQLSVISLGSSYLRLFYDCSAMTALNDFACLPCEYAH